MYSWLFVCLMVLNITFNNISAISWRSVSLVEEIGRPEKTTIRYSLCDSGDIKYSLCDSVDIKYSLCDSRDIKYSLCDDYVDIKYLLCDS